MGCGKTGAGKYLTKGRQIRETPQSRGGHHFAGPGEEIYRNLGMITLEGRTTTARPRRWTSILPTEWSSLLSVAQMNDVGNLAVFDAVGDRQGSRIIKGNSPAWRAIRQAVREATAKKEGTAIRRVKNTYYMNLWIKKAVTAVKDNMEGFTRQESKRISFDPYARHACLNSLITSP